MALVGIDPIDPLVSFLGRFRVLTAAVYVEATTHAAVGVAAHAPDQVLSADFGRGEAVMVGAVDVLSAHCLVIHLHDVSRVTRWIALFILV
jgi:hypothetical protein